MDKVFVPIHDSEHWFSALIDYHSKKIKIYDSWQPTYELNHMQNIEQQKNVPLMLVSNRLSQCSSFLTTPPIGSDVGSRSVQHNS